MAEAGDLRRASTWQSKNYLVVKDSARHSPRRYRLEVRHVGAEMCSSATHEAARTTLRTSGGQQRRDARWRCRTRTRPLCQDEMGFRDLVEASRDACVCRRAATLPSVSNTKYLGVTFSTATVFCQPKPLTINGLRLVLVSGRAGED